MEDSLYVRRLEETVIRLEKVESQNEILTFAFMAMVILILAAGIFIFIRVRLNRRRDRLTGSLLMGHAETLPGFTRKVSALSGKSIKLSIELYEEFQNAIDSIRKQQHDKHAVIVNDEQFAADYPDIARNDALSPTEKLVSVLTKEGYDSNRIALLLGTSAASVRAIKSRIKSKNTKI